MEALVFCHFVGCQKVELDRVLQLLPDWTVGDMMSTPTPKLSSVREPSDDIDHFLSAMWPVSGSRTGWVHFA